MTLLIWIVLALGLPLVPIVLYAVISSRPVRATRTLAGDLSWEGIRLRAPAAIAWAAGADEVAAEAAATRMPLARRAPRVIVSGDWMARPSVRRAAASDWAFSFGASPMIVVCDDAGVELWRATVARLHGEHQAVVLGLSVSHAMPGPGPAAALPDDETSREGGPFAADIGFRLDPPQAPRTIRVRAELGPLRSDPVAIRLLP